MHRASTVQAHISKLSARRVLCAESARCGGAAGNTSTELDVRAQQTNIIGRRARSKTLWPSGLRRWLKAPFRKGVGSNPTGVTFEPFVAHAVCMAFRSVVEICLRGLGAAHVLVRMVCHVRDHSARRAAHMLSSA